MLTSMHPSGHFETHALQPSQSSVMKYERFLMILAQFFIFIELEDRFVFLKQRQNEPRTHFLNTTAKRHRSALAIRSSLNPCESKRFPGCQLRIESRGAIDDEIKTLGVRIEHLHGARFGHSRIIDHGDYYALHIAHDARQIVDEIHSFFLSPMRFKSTTHPDAV